MSTFVNSCQAGVGTNLTRAPFLRWLNPNGDGLHTGAAAIGNYSGAVTDFYYQVPTGFTYKIAIIIITISCSSSINQNDYGNIAGGLINGVSLHLRRNGVETQLIGGLTVKKNFEFLAATSDSSKTDFSGGAQTIQFAFNTFEELGSYIDLNGDASDRIIWRLNDNFTTLVNHKCVIRGIIER